MAAMRATPTHAVRWKVALLYSLTVTTLFVASAEIGLRMSGWKPWERVAPAVQVTPGERFFVKDPTLGYTHIPGTFTVTLGTGHSFRVTHLPNTFRVTKPLAGYGRPGNKKEIWLFGCSITHGWSLNDEQTYPWRLQERFPDYEVVNYGVSGYGTIHSLLQFRDALERKSPKIAVVAYAGFHDRRNTFLRIRQKRVAPLNKLGPLMQPYARLGQNGQLRFGMAEVEYREFPFMRYSALSHFLESKYDELEEGLYQGHRVSEVLVQDMAGLARRHDVQLVVAGITPHRDTQSMLRFAHEHGILSIDISGDPNVPGYLNLPYDNHPSALANKQFAEKLETFLRAEIPRL